MGGESCKLKLGTQPLLISAVPLGEDGISSFGIFLLVGACEFTDMSLEEIFHFSFSIKKIYN